MYKSLYSNYTPTLDLGGRVTSSQLPSLDHLFCFTVWAPCLLAIGASFSLYARPSVRSYTNIITTCVARHYLSERTVKEARPSFCVSTDAWRRLSGQKR
jgi:hypothetical protein